MKTYQIFNLYWCILLYVEGFAKGLWRTLFFLPEDYLPSVATDQVPPAPQSRPPVAHVSSSSFSSTCRVSPAGISLHSTALHQVHRINHNHNYNYEQQHMCMSYPLRHRQNQDVCLGHELQYAPEEAPSPSEGTCRRHGHDSDDEYGYIAEFTTNTGAIAVSSSSYPSPASSSMSSIPPDASPRRTPRESRLNHLEETRKMNHRLRDSALLFTLVGSPPPSKKPTKSRKKRRCTTNITSSILSSWQ